MKRKVIVVGAGIIGTSIAYYLSKKNVNVVLIEAKDIAAGTSGACDKAIMLQSKRSGPTLSLAIDSAKMYEDLERELGQNLEYKKCGGMILIENEHELHILQQMSEQQNKTGLPVSILSKEEVRKRNPYVSNDIIASTWCTEDAEVNPMETAFAFARAAYLNGVQILLNREVIRLIQSQNQIIGVETTHGKVFADQVVICSGVWTKNILETIEIDIPIIPRKGIILVSEKLPKIFPHNILSGAYIVSKLTQDSESVKYNPHGVGLAIGQTGDGSLLIGGSREFVGFEEAIPAEVIRQIAQKAIKAFPILEHVHMIRSFSGFRPFTPDYLPILSKVPSVDGLFVAAGHEGDGIALAPITGKIMSQLVMGECIDYDLSAFSINRFLQKV